MDFKGLSRAKNFGIAKEQKKLVCFPDDDSFIRDDLKDNFYFFIESMELNNFDAVWKSL